MSSQSEDDSSVSEDTPSCACEYKGIPSIYSSESDSDISFFRSLKRGEKIFNEAKIKKCIEKNCPPIPEDYERDSCVHDHLYELHERDATESNRLHIGGHVSLRPELRRRKWDIRLGNCIKKGCIVRPRYIRLRKSKS